MEVKRDEHGRPRVYLEEDCPIEELGIECQREGSAAKHPPHSRLHVWWARRPLMVSRASVLGSLLPAGYERKDFLRLMGIEGNPIADKQRINDANLIGAKLKVGFSYKRAFTNPISLNDMVKMKKAIKNTWGEDEVKVLDAFAGGGSIPFESVRMGFETIANELNPVASVIEKATIEYPLLFGGALTKDIETIGESISKALEKELAQAFPKNPGEDIFAYIWVRTVRCSKCSLTVPLAPNWWLNSEEKIGYRPVVPAVGIGDTCSFQILRSSDSFDPESGRSRGASPPALVAATSSMAIS